MEWTLKLRNIKPISLMPGPLIHRHRDGGAEFRLRLMGAPVLVTFPCPVHLPIISRRDAKGGLGHPHGVDTNT